MYKFESEKQNMVNGLNSFLEGIYMGEEVVGDYRNKAEDIVVRGEFEHILKAYERHEGYIKNLIRSFGEFPSHSIGVQGEILELFNNVKNLLINKDVDLMKHCIKSIELGRYNASKFIETQEDELDEKTLNIMKAIVSEYSHHINHLKEAIDILEN